VTAVYDIDTPVTLAKLERGDFEYLSPELIPGYDVYLSFTGGPTLEWIRRRYGAPAAHALYCSVDPEPYAPLNRPKRWDLSYLGTYSPDRQPTLERLLLAPARRASQLKFVVAGPLYPAGIDWPPNVERIDHVAPTDHPAFYAASRFTLNVTRSDMVRAGYSPSVRLFEAAACGIPTISDVWEGIDTIFAPGQEIALAGDSGDVLDVLVHWPEERARGLAEASRRRVLAAHTAAHRALELERFLLEAFGASPKWRNAQPAVQPAPVKRSIVSAG
jgi:spore maturation protein CgeB